MSDEKLEMKAVIFLHQFSISTRKRQEIKDFTKKIVL